MIFFIIETYFETNLIKLVSKLPKSIKVLEALYSITTTWLIVFKRTVYNCLTGAGFRKTKAPAELFNTKYYQQDYLPLSKLVQLLKK